MWRSSSIAKHRTRMCSSIPQMVRTNELDYLFGSVIHFSREFFSGNFVESVLRRLSYRNTIFGRLFWNDRFWPQQCLLLIVHKIILERCTSFSIKIIRNLYCEKYFPRTFRHWFRRDRFWPQQLAPSSLWTFSVRFKRVAWEVRKVRQFRRN